MSWRVIDSGRGSAEGNMRVDGLLLKEMELSKRPTLHLYEWEGLSATYGHFAVLEKLLDMEGVKRVGLQLGRRPTGGGVIFHQADYAFSVLIPSSHPRFSLNTLENYALINNAVIDAVALFAKNGPSPELYDASSVKSRHLFDNFCMAKPTKYDVMIDGHKVGGAAQRRTKAGFLHQGSISLAMPSKELLYSVLKEKEEVAAAMHACSYTLLGQEWSQRDLSEARAKLKELLKEKILSI